MSPGYAVTMNGRVSTELKPRPGRSTDEELRFRLALLDGAERFALLLWRLPDGVPFDLVNLDSGPAEYIQCAGGVLGRFTCEVRRTGPDGQPRHEVIGRLPGDQSAVPTEVVRWTENETIVRRSEVLDANEIADLFGSYLASGEIPIRYATRVLVS
jgi:hypothetical protein